MSQPKFDVNSLGSSLEKVVGVSSKVASDSSKFVFPTFQTVVKYLIYLFLVLYASFLRPELPVFVKNLFKNNIFKFFIFMLIILLAATDNDGGDILLALLVAIAFFATSIVLNEISIREKFEERFREKFENRQF